MNIEPETVSKFEEYLISLNYSPNTVNAYKLAIRQYGESPNAYEFLNGERNRGNSVNTRVSKYYYLVTWFKFLDRLGIPHEILNFKAPRREKKEAKAMTKEEIGELLAILEDHPEREARTLALVSLLIATGCRLSEALSIRLDGTQKHTYIEEKRSRRFGQTHKDYYVHFRQTKTNTERKNLIDSAVMSIIENYATQKTIISPYLFSQLRSPKKWSRQEAYMAIRKALTAAGYQENHPHVFRASFVTHLINAHVPEGQICAVAGMTRETLQKYYAMSEAVLRAVQKKAIIDFNSFLKNKKAHKKEDL